MQYHPEQQQFGRLINGFASSVGTLRYAIGAKCCRKLENICGVDPIVSSSGLIPAFALGMEGLIPEAIRKMENLRSKHDVELGVAMALLYFHGKAKMVDRCTERVGSEHYTFLEDEFRLPLQVII